MRMEWAQQGSLSRKNSSKTALPNMKAALLDIEKNLTKIYPHPTEKEEQQRSELLSALNNIASFHQYSLRSRGYAKSVKEDIALLTPKPVAIHKPPGKPAYAPKNFREAYDILANAAPVVAEGLKELNQLIATTAVTAR